MNVGVWIRVSSDMQVETESIEHHIEKAETFCREKGWNIVTTYMLDGVSGKDVRSHPETQRMYADVRAGKIQALVFSKLARLARSLITLLEMSENIFKPNNIELVSIDEKKIDTSDPSGRLFYNLLAIFAEWEREEIAARVAASVPPRARLGKFLGGIGPFGYSWRDVYGTKKLGINEDEAATVRRAYTEFIRSQNILLTCKILNEAGLRPRKTTWNNRTMKRILTDSVYTGKYRRNYTKSGGNKKSWTLKPEKDWIFNDIDPIVSDGEWAEVQSILAGRTAKYSTGVPKEGKYLLSGKLLCVNCNTKMYVAPYKKMPEPKYLCKKCNLRLSQNLILEPLREQLKLLIVRPELLTSDSDSEELYKSNEEQLKKAIRDEAKTKASLSTLLDLLIEGKFSKDTIVEKQGIIEKQQTQLQAEISRLKSEIDKYQKLEKGRQTILEKAKSLDELWDELSKDDKRKIIRDLIVEVQVHTIDNKSVSLEIVFQYLTGITDGYCKSTEGQDKSIESYAHGQGFMAATSMTRAG